MSIMDQLPMTNLRCMRLIPDTKFYPGEGERCRFHTDHEHLMRHHQGMHDGYEATRPHRWWDNCPHCGGAIRLTKALVLRVHGHPARRCIGSSLPGLFMLNCRDELHPRQVDQ